MNQPRLMMKSLLPIALFALVSLFVSCHKQIDTTYSVSMNCDYVVPASSQVVMDSLEIGVPTTEIKNTCVQESINESQISYATVKGIHLSIDPALSQTFLPFTDVEFYLTDMKGNLIRKIGQTNALNNNTTTLDVDVTLENITQLITEDQVKIVWIAKSNKPILKSFAVHANLDIDFTAVIYN